MTISRRSARRCVRCARTFPGEYWRKLDRERAYPAEFVDGADQGRLPRRADPRAVWRQRAHHAWRPRAIMEEIHAAGCNGAACHAQMYIMGTVLRHGSDAQKQQYLPAIARGRAAPAGLRRHRADLRHRYAQPAHHGGARRRSILCGQRPEDLDLARRIFRSHAAALLARRRATRRRSAPTACRSSSSTCAPRKASPSSRSAP